MRSQLRSPAVLGLVFAASLFACVSPRAGKESASGAAQASEAPANAPGLRFVRDGALVREASIHELRAACASRIVEIADDPYYLGDKRFHALPLPCVLERGFGVAAQTLAREDIFLRARDRYTRPAAGAQLTGCCAYLAFSDAALTSNADAAARAPHWAPIDRRQVDPAPFYLIWSEPGQNDAHRYPWPYQLSEIEIADFASQYPHTEPRGAALGSPARDGFAIFRRECIACHSINGEGGKVGPELNIPQSIVDYRPPEQIRAYIRNPQSFRYTSMPAHPHLSDADLDGLLAYFRAMSALKLEPAR